EAGLFGRRPDRGHLAGGGARPDQVDRRVEVIAAALVGVEQRTRGAGHRERAVVARAIAHVAVEDVEVGGITGAQGPIGKHVRMRAAALTRDRVDALYEL